jgi:uncharacterized protein (DUF305 family)
MKLTANLLAAAAMLFLTACGGKAAPAGEPETSDHSQQMAGDTPTANTADLTQAQAAYKAANDTMHALMADIPADPDVAFMQGMLAHHQGAVAMSEVALKYAKDAKARDLAARVIAAQTGEIAEMQAWLKERAAK